MFLQVELDLGDRFARHGSRPYCRRLIVPSGPTRYWPVIGWVPAVLANWTETSGLASSSDSFLVIAVSGLFDGHARHADPPIGRPQTHDALAFDQIKAVDRLVEDRAEHADLEHVVDVDPIGRQRHHFEHFDLQDIGRLDPIARQRDHRPFARRLKGRRDRLLEACRHEKSTEWHPAMPSITATASKAGTSDRTAERVVVMGVIGGYFRLRQGWEYAGYAQWPCKHTPIDTVGIIGKLEPGLCPISVKWGDSGIDSMG